MPQLLRWFSLHGAAASFAWALPFCCALAMTPCVMAVARARGLVAKPRADRWHSQPTALFGGVAIFAACGLALGLANGRGALWQQFAGALLGASAMFALGLWDDARPLKPLAKFGLQMGAAVGFGAWFYRSQGQNDIAWLIPFAIVWVAGVTNALNLLDNMDGLSAGVAAICGVFLAANAALSGDSEVALLALGVSGAAAGFLVWNFNPARIFMGDCGSLFLGFSLAALSLMGRHGLLAGNFSTALLSPALVLATPVFDTLFVSLARLSTGRSPAQGGRDHTSHRLVLLGLTERRAVLWLYGVTAWFGLVALWGASIKQPLATLAATVASLLALLVFGGFLAEAQAYSEEELERARSRKGVVSRARRLRPLVKIGADGALCAACLISAYLLKYDGDLRGGRGDQLLRLLPYVLLAQLGAFVGCGLYRRPWRDANVSDVASLSRGVLFGSLAAYALSRVMPGAPRVLVSLLGIDGALLLLGMGGTRVGMKALRHHFTARWTKTAEVPQL